jgi:hypothetical protein
VFTVSFIGADSAPCWIEEILKEWESFASTMLPGKQFNKVMLRNDAAATLSTIAKRFTSDQVNHHRSP